MRVVDRRRVLPEVTIGLNKGETTTLASILSKSELEKEFCQDLLTKIDEVLKDDDFKEWNVWSINHLWFWLPNKNIGFF